MTVMISWVLWKPTLSCKWLAAFTGVVLYLAEWSMPFLASTGAEGWGVGDAPAAHRSGLPALAAIHMRPGTAPGCARCKPYRCFIRDACLPCNPCCVVSYMIGAMSGSCGQCQAAHMPHANGSGAISGMGV